MSAPTVLVTGAAGGLGRAFALGFAGLGHRVAVADLDAEGAAETARLSEEAGAPATWSGRVDVTSATDTARAAEAAADLGEGRIDVVVNNAAVYATLNRSPLEDIDPDEFDLVMRVNVKGPWLVVRAASPYLGAGSSVVNVASATVLSGSEQWLHYVASKGAVVAMTRTMAKELGRREIRVNTLAPGFVLTEASYGQMGEDAATYGVDRGALRRSCDPADVVGACLFLAGEGAGFVTGQTLVVDGGRQFL
ncbi:SDR family NAD(P)-dependent oxidoreductase [Nocardioides sp. CFH 31398]|uniref:SDR family NAD(P)-dependent oxidoreductase n=1 Tax=Nocardioides sp. CFH 31398 TaxID=2919579 RepID=UPI001F06BFE7|nr:SDR family oxidoreductase [Nocardioides sp. CFH 31398]MCH1865509.1 SDR family oxidoreductase [Nocardioides sp. CFH 31398]